MTTIEKVTRARLKCEEAARVGGQAAAAMHEIEKKMPDGMTVNQAVEAGHLTRDEVKRASDLANRAEVSLREAAEAEAEARAALNLQN
jgi:uncharacterized protein YaiL (DUF2058 family)